MDPIFWNFTFKTCNLLFITCRQRAVINTISIYKYKRKKEKKSGKATKLEGRLEQGHGEEKRRRRIRGRNGKACKGQIRIEKESIRKTELLTSTRISVELRNSQVKLH